MSHPMLRIDTQHHLLDLMQTAVDRIAGSDIRVQLVRESVLLSGDVDCWHQKQFAQESIRRYAGERMISNDIRVKSQKLNQR